MNIRLAGLWLLGLSCLALALAPLEWPYAYYSMLRYLVTISCALGLIGFWGRLPGWHIGGLAACILVFNPVIPVHLDRGTWLFIDLAAAVFVGTLVWTHSPKTTTGRPEDTAGAAEPVRVADDGQLSASQERERWWFFIWAVGLAIFFLVPLAHVFRLT